MQKLHISTNYYPPYAPPERTEMKPPELLAQGLTPGSRYTIENIRDGLPWEVRAVAVLTQGEVVAQTPTINFRGLPPSDKPNPAHLPIKEDVPPGPLTFCGFVPCGHYGEQGLRALISYPHVQREKTQIVVQLSTDGKNFEIVEETHAVGLNRWCTVPVEPGGVYWMRALTRTRTTGTPSEDVLRLQVPTQS